MKKITLKRIVLLMVLAFTVQNFSFAQGATEQPNTARDGQTYRIRNMATGNYLAYDDTLGKYAPVAFDANDETQVHRFMSNSTVISGSTFYTIDMGGPGVSRGVMRMAGAGAMNEVFSTTKQFDATSGMTDKVQNVWELGGEIILIQAKTANSYLTEQDQAFFDANGFWFQGPAITDPIELNQQWLLEAGTLSNEEFDSSSIFISNPVNSEISIKGLTADVNSISVFSLIGKQVLSREVNGETSLTLDSSALSSGMYLVKIQGDNGAFTKKIVKQ
ncbi:T9SS type A sorting domain-containing protein [Hyunsoonleella flava]|uniref:T9SS type A sorting domain-containing protein n=1 Tax=Hyunsoonleella flava TaxID=2527939 RepID=A0A4Q9FDT5_9FLAO|nr:T9SS type A sorting domain-containing protein [Hyunsoonleella flava]TBN02947.1 T9SS type A sorting domain-containing protein [Hyunsoonleella flava]